MTKHSWFLAAGASVLGGWFFRAHAFLLTTSIAFAGYCLYRGGKAVSDPVGRKGDAMSTAVLGADAGPPDGGQSSAVNLPQRSSGTSGKPTWGSGRKNQMFRSPAYAPSNSQFGQTRFSGDGTSGLTFPGGVKYTPNYGPITSKPVADSVSPVASPTAATAVVPPQFLGQTKGDMSFFDVNELRSLSNPFRN